MKRKFSGKGRYVKRRRIAPAKSIRRIARGAVLRAAETKNRVYDSPGNTMLKNTLLTWNVMYAVAMQRGTGHDQVIGDEIFLKGVKLAYEFTTTLDEALYYELAVVKTDKFATTSSLTYTDVSHDDTAYADQMMLDSDKVKVVYHTRGKLIQSGPSGSRHGHIVNHYCKINKKVRFRSLAASTELQYSNYYVLAYAYTYSGLIASTAVCQVVPQQLRVYWKDI